MKRSCQTARTGLAALALVGLLAGCGGDDSSSDAGAASGGGAKASPIKLMLVAPVKAPIQNYPDVPAGARAAAKAINEDGGVNGRPIEIIHCNHNNDTNVSTACARKAVSEGAVATVGQSDIYSPATFPVYEAAGMAIIGNAPSGNPEDVDSPNAFPFGGGSNQAYMAGVALAKSAGNTKVAAAALDVASALASVKPVQDAAKRAGSEFVGTIKIPVTASDYAPFAQRIKELGADNVQLILNAAATGGLLKAAKASGIEAMFVQNGYAVGQPEVDAMGDAAEGLTIVNAFPPPNAASEFPGVQHWLDDLQAAGSMDPVLRRVNGLNAWLAVRAAAKVIAGLDGDVTVQKVLDAVRATKEMDLEGLVTWKPAASGPPGFSKVPVSIYYHAQVKGGRIELMDSTPIDVYKTLGFDGR